MPALEPWSAAILAGGQGRRLDGQVKPLLAWTGRTILQRQAAALSALGVTPRLIAPDATPFRGLPFEVVADVVAHGALGALYSAILTSPTPYVLVLAGDLPFVTATFLEAMLARRGEADAVVPAPGGRLQPLCGVYHRRAAPRLEQHIARRQWRVVDALSDLTVHVMTDQDLAPFDHDGRLLLNVNTPHDLDRAKADVPIP